MDGGERHSGIGEDPVPFAEGLVCSDQDGPALIAGRYQIEQYAGLGLILGDAGEVIQDEQVKLVEFCDGGFELQLAARDLKFLDKIGRSGEEDAPAVLHRRQANGCSEMAFAAPRWAEHQHVRPFGQAHLIEGDAKVAALHAMIERFYPGRDAGLRPFSVQDIKATTVIGMEIEEALAKIRAAENLDEPGDMNNPSWAGVIPVATVIGAAQPCPNNPVQPIFAGLEGYVAGAELDAVIRGLAPLTTCRRRLRCDQVGMDTTFKGMFQGKPFQSNCLSDRSSDAA